MVSLLRFMGSCQSEWGCPKDKTWRHVEDVANLYHYIKLVSCHVLNICMLLFGFHHGSI